MAVVYWWGSTLTVAIHSLVTLRWTQWKCDSAARGVTSPPGTLVTALPSEIAFGLRWGATSDGHPFTMATTQP